MLVIRRRNDLNGIVSPALSEALEFVVAAQKFL
jgi:hypothetical protein